MLFTMRKINFIYKVVVNIYIVYEIILWPYHQGNKSVLRNSLFDAVRLAKNAGRECW